MSRFRDFAAFVIVIVGATAAEASDDFHAIVHLVERSVGSLGRLCAAVE